MAGGSLPSKDHTNGKGTKGSIGNRNSDNSKILNVAGQLASLTCCVVSRYGNSTISQKQTKWQARIPRIQQVAFKTKIMLSLFPLQGDNLPAGSSVFQQGGLMPFQVGILLC